jgi:hypothetical protein
MKNSNDTVGNRTRDLPACSAVPQPTAPPAACPNPSLKQHLFNVVSIITQYDIRRLKMKLLERSDQQINRT